MNRNNVLTLETVTEWLAIVGLEVFAQDKYTVRCPDASVPETLLNVDFMVKDSQRFTDIGGWGWAVFDYHPESAMFAPATTAGSPPQGNDAKCGLSCHTRMKAKDYVFTEYGKR